MNYISQHASEKNNGQQNGPRSRMLFSELYNIIVNKATFVGFWGDDHPPWVWPCLLIWLKFQVTLHLFCI